MLTTAKPHERDGGPGPASAPIYHHPRLGEKGEQVHVKNPSQASAPSTWHNPDAVATFVPDGDAPLSLHGVPFLAWRDHPRTNEGWGHVDGVNEDLHEPPFHPPRGKKAASGVVVEEPDGRVWLIAPTNQFGGYKASFPKGTAEPALSLQANAIKECFEEAGLQVEITGFVGDFARTTSVARLYRGRRVGGTPTAMGWESQAVHLVPKGHLYEYLNMWSDHKVAEIIGAGPSPDVQKGPKIQLSECPAEVRK
ncbi:ADP-ribose pyrophosphatase YjhB (NUDIX family) [Mesorhizobium soli]|uniref:NUDIX hydrolase n=1 Tax=Pseudaminobacter soli (ex Li et al. 2025) TaxID=1295366 RepID=UPI00247459E9|nr:NUDIX hydrolase [Mesorhizobium soli]MDH6232992.1 ADP-ribose pyrophosphatase YjhB (NUDIX family) [Mesorhizobium soli]